MVKLLRRLALLCTGVIGLSLLTAAPALAATTVTGDVSGPNVEPLGGQVLFCPGPEYSSCGGNNFSDGAFSVSHADGDFKIRVVIPSMDDLSRYYQLGQAGGTADAASATVFTLTGTPLQLEPLQLPAIATLSGTVTNGLGQSMPGVTVFRNRGGSVRSTTTDGFGQYDFGYVREGTQSVSVNSSGPWAGAQQSVTVPASGEVVADLVMPAAAHIAGTLTDQGSGQPIPFLEVLVFRKSDSAYQNTVTTDANGHFDVGGLGGGGFVLRYSDNLNGYPAQFNGGALTSGSATPIVTTAGQTTTHDEVLTLKPAPWGDPAQDPPETLGGTVTDDLGAPLADIVVEVVDGTGTIADARTDRLGRWAVIAPAGDYLVRYREGTWQSHYYPSPTPWFPEYYPDDWTAATAATVAVPTTGQLLGVDAALGRSARLAVAVTGPSGTTDLNAGYQIHDAGTGAVVAGEAPVAAGGSQLGLLLRPGSWKVLVSGRTTQATNGTPLLRRWYAGGVSLSSARTVDVVAGTVLTGSVVLPGKLRPTTKPRVKGRPKPGKRLTATKGAWNLMTGTSFRVKWKRGNKVVGSKAKYLVKRRDSGKVLTALVTARNGGLSATVRIKVRIR